MGSTGITHNLPAFSQEFATNHALQHYPEQPWELVEVNRPNYVITAEGIWNNSTLAYLTITRALAEAN